MRTGLGRACLSWEDGAARGGGGGTRGARRARARTRNSVLALFRRMECRCNGPHARSRAREAAACAARSDVSAGSARGEAEQRARAALRRAARPRDPAHARRARLLTRPSGTGALVTGPAWLRPRSLAPPRCTPRSHAARAHADQGRLGGRCGRLGAVWPGLIHGDGGHLPRGRRGRRENAHLRAVLEGAPLRSWVLAGACACWGCDGLRAARPATRVRMVSVQWVCVGD